MNFSNLISRNTIIDIISSLLLMLFLYTAISKLLDLTSFIIAIAKSPIEIIYKNAKLIGYTVPVVEIIIVVLLFFPKFRNVGLWMSFILMSIFTAYVAYMLLAHHTELPCTCGGVISKMTWPQHLVLNIIFTVMAGLGLYLRSNNRTHPPLSRQPQPA